MTALRQLIVGLLPLALCAQTAAPKPRLFVLTDISNEPDDEESLVRLLVYANMLISGMGHVFGEYIILEVGDKRSEFMNNGAAQKVEFSIKLKRYDDDSTALESINDALSS